MNKEELDKLIMSGEVKWFKETERMDYFVSKSGIVYSVRRNNKKIYILSQPINRLGYKQVTIGKKHHRIHRILAMTFIPNPENKSDVNHIDGDKLNNSLDNLEWSTRKENMKHAWDNGLMENNRNRLYSPRTMTEKFEKALVENGKKVGRTRRSITFEQAQEIRELYATGEYKQKELAEKYGCHKSTVSQIINNTRYTVA